MSEIHTEEVIEFTKNVEAELLKVTVQKHEQNESQQAILSQIEWNPIFEEEVKQVVEQSNHDENKRKLEVEWVQLICVESHPILVFS